MTWADTLKPVVGVRQALHGLGATNFEELYRDGHINPIRKAASKGVQLRYL